MNNTYILSNGIQMPILSQGLPLIGEIRQTTKKDLYRVLDDTFSLDIWGLDTSHDYGMSETWIGDYLNHHKNVNREKVFITTKIGNSQQEEGFITKYVDNALKTLKVDYIDLMLLHWPYPGYVENWEKLITEYEKGKIRSIGIANAQIRHLEKFEKASLPMPHVVQTEIHPLNTCMPLQKYCNEHNIQLQACTSLCVMWPIIREQKIIHQIAKSYKKEFTQIILRWHLQHHIAPIFRSFNYNHLKQFTEIFDFELTQEEMFVIDELNINYRCNPESLNCPGF